ncbi:DNA gyrase subunit A [Mycoplasmatota bacterium]|nr:DNA gyrase subunit A [Mycoplasmatota bacterium]
MSTYDKIQDVNISNEMKESFLNYAMSVIVSRALPDVRDGLKPVHRRILYGMSELNMQPNSAYKKSARLVGDVMGKYHPHGDSSIYEAMVRMAQDFSYRYMLVNGHGNFGSIDGDGAAAMRYTEAKMAKITMEMLRDINKNTIDYRDNYDGSEQEPSVLPSRFPNLLVNGATGIAVGMATNIPPHNLSEVIDGILATVDNPDIEIEELMNYIKGPDFPTGGELLGLSGLRQAYLTGKGSVVIRSKCDIIEHKNGKKSIIVTEIPYQVNKSKLITKIAELAKEKKVEGITDLRDESNRKGIRIVIELKRDINADVTLNNLFKFTQLQSSFGMNVIALVKDQPKKLNLKEMLIHYIEHQITVIVRRTQFDLDKALARVHIVKGLLIALENIDRIIKIVRGSKTDDDAKVSLIEEFELSEIQARAILDMRLRRLTGLEKEKLELEKKSLEEIIKDLTDILASKERQDSILIEEISEIKRKFGDDRRTTINLTDSLSIEDEDLIPVEDVIITITNKGYIKRITADTYRNQNRGGKGLTGQKTYEDDFVEHILYTSTHDTITFFSNVGKVYRMKGYAIPSASRTSKGIPLVNLLKFGEGETLATVLRISEFKEGQYLLFGTKRGLVKRTDIRAYANIRSNGLRAISLRDGDELLKVRITDGKRDIIMGASNGKAIRFNEKDVRIMGRVTSGVRGIKLGSKEEVIGITVINEERNEILVVTEYGYGKRTNVDEYRLQTRGGKGVKTLNVTEKNGNLVSLRSVSENDDLLIITDKGMIIRMDVGQISQTGRATQGVRLIRLNDEHSVSTIALVPQAEEEIISETVVNQ